MNSDLKAILAGLLSKRQEFENSNNPSSNDEEWYVSYHAFEAFGQTIILEAFEDHMTVEREFLIYDGQTTIRSATPYEDQILRAADDDEPMLEDDDVHFILCKDHENIVHRCDDTSRQSE
jgi:hypothetical protein